MDDVTAAAAMEEDANPVANKLCREIGLDAAVRQRKKGAAKLRAATDLAAAVAAAEERGYQNCLAAAKTAANQRPASQRPAIQRPGNDPKPLRTADNSITKPDRRWACHRCNCVIHGPAKSGVIANSLFHGLFLVQRASLAQERIVKRVTVSHGSA